MSIDYRMNDPGLSGAALAELFRSAGLTRPSDDVPRITAMIEHADLVLTAWDGERLVGVARALTDFVYCCYLSDLAIDRAYQNRGIGRELVRRLQERLGPDVMILLLSVPEAMGYYPRLGFQWTENAWRIPRAR